jgi:hypothetical protein
MSNIRDTQMGFSWNVILVFAEKVVDFFWNSPEVKRFVVHLLERYAQSTDNEVDNVLVDVVRKKLLG